MPSRSELWQPYDFADEHRWSMDALVDYKEALRADLDHAGPQRQAELTHELRHINFECRERLLAAMVLERAMGLQGAQQ